MPELPLQGILPALTTPFDFDGELDLAGLRHNVEKYLQAGFTGFVALDETGEGPSLTGDERKAVLKTIREMVGEDAPILAGISEQSTVRATRAILEATQAGADGALVLTPFFYGKRIDQKALLRFFRELADSSPIPIVIDHEPGITSAIVEPQTLQELAGHSRIVGFRDGSGNQSTLGQTIRAAPEGFRVFVGRAGVLLPGLDVGAAGAILAEAGLAPHQCVELFECARDGRKKARATALQTRLGPLAQALANRWGLPGLKASLGLAGYAGGPPRSPLGPIPKQDRDRLAAVLKQTGFFPLLTQRG